jgi:hypothetical protein
MTPVTKQPRRMIHPNFMGNPAAEHDEVPNHCAEDGCVPVAIDDLFDEARFGSKTHLHYVNEDTFAVTPGGDSVTNKPQVTVARPTRELELEKDLAELNDLFACVLDHATGGRASKPYDKETCYAIIDDWTEQLCREAVEEDRRNRS